MTVWVSKKYGYGRTDGKGAVINLALTGQGEGYVPRPTFSDGLRHSIRTRPTEGSAKVAVLKYAGTDYTQLPASEAPDSPGRSAAPPTPNNKENSSVTASNQELEAKIDRLEGIIVGMAARVAGQVEAPVSAPVPEPAPAPVSEPEARGGFWAAPGVTWQAFKAARNVVRNRTYRYGGGWRTRKGYKLPRAIFVVEVDNQLRDWGWSPFYAQHAS